MQYSLDLRHPTASKKHFEELLVTPRSSQELSKTPRNSDKLRGTQRNTKSLLRMIQSAKKHGYLKIIAVV